MSAWWLAAGVLVSVVSLIALVRAVIALARLHRGSVLLTVPLASERVVHFDDGIVFSRAVRRLLVIKILQIVLFAFVATGSIALTIVALLVEA